MALDILNIKPHVVSRDLCGYTVTFYGTPKTGKTTTAAQFPSSLLLAFEKGYSAIPGVMAQPINRWSEFRQVIKQLKTDEAHETFKNIIVDTADIAYDYCEKYVCSQNNVDKINEIPYGGGYKQAEHEFDEMLRAIPQMGYGLILISHSQEKTFTDENGLEYQKIVPTLANKPRNIVNRMSDIIGYAHPVTDEDGATTTILHMRGTVRFEAGSRFKYTPEDIVFTYQNLVNAIGDAIDKQAAEFNNELVTDNPNMVNQVEELNFDALMNEFNSIVDKLQSNVSESDFGTVWAPRIIEITDKYLGKGKKVSDATRSQTEQLALIVSDLTEIIGLGI